MSQKPLYVLVEGPTDQMLFQSEAMDQVVRQRFPYAHVITWASETKDDLVGLLRGIIADGAPYIFLCDKESAFVCIQTRKQYALSRCPNVAVDRILIVVREIECWYIAGMSQTFSNQYGFAIPDNSEDFAKPRFEDLSTRLKFASPEDMMIEILKTFSVQNAALRNTSFSRLVEKYLS